MEAPLAEYENKTSRQRYMSNKRYTGFRELVFVSSPSLSLLSSAADPL